MMSSATHSRFLPLFSPDGTWAVERPDLWLLARLSRSDKQDDEVAQIYRTMLDSDANSPINDFERDVRKHTIGQNTGPRVRSGEVVLESWRIMEHTGHVPKLSHALALVALGVQGDARKAGHEAKVKNFRDDFSLYRNTAHLQGALVLWSHMGALFEGEEAETRRFLACARALEQVMDAVAALSTLAWSPWRIPSVIEPAIPARPAPLSKADLMALGPSFGV
jgi:hypothetical protein